MAPRPEGDSEAAGEVVVTDVEVIESEVVESEVVESEVIVEDEDEVEDVFERVEYGMGLHTPFKTANPR